MKQMLDLLSNVLMSSRDERMTAVLTSQGNVTFIVDDLSLKNK